MILIWSENMGDENGPTVVNEHAENVENGSGEGSAPQYPELQESENVAGGPSSDGPQSLALSVGPPSPLTGCYLLIIIGEPYSEEHKDIILQKLLKGESI